LEECWSYLLDTGEGICECDDETDQHFAGPSPFLTVSPR
jgi:hypothetical protein